jgi:hypothetical protein
MLVLVEEHEFSELLHVDAVATGGAAQHAMDEIQLAISVWYGERSVTLWAF